MELRRAESKSLIRRKAVKVTTGAAAAVIAAFPPLFVTFKNTFFIIIVHLFNKTHGG